jgi:hypothetical protein
MFRAVVHPAIWLPFFSASSLAQFLALYVRKAKLSPDGPEDSER